MLFSGLQLDESHRDQLHAKLVGMMARHPSGCTVYTGTKQTPSGIGVLRFRRRQFVAARVAAWLWCGVEFDLMDRRVTVRHLEGCRPDCIDPGHLRVEFRRERRRGWWQPTLWSYS